MSKPESGQSIPTLSSMEQVKYFANRYRDSVTRDMFDQIVHTTRRLNLDYSEDELLIISALDNPYKVQRFLNEEIFYNNDHQNPETEETAMSPRQVIRTGKAHCFEEGLLAYTVNFLHGHQPKFMLLEASQDSDHNLCVLQDPKTGLYGANAHSKYPHLDGRDLQYANIGELARSYLSYYYSDKTNDPQDITLVGYSELFDLIDKYGVGWMASEEMLWDIYYTYMDDKVHFHYLFDKPESTHLYSTVKALQQKWIVADLNQMKGVLQLNNLPANAESLWDRFWKEYDSASLNDQIPRGLARKIEQEFFQLTGTTPIDLRDNNSDFEWFLKMGYRPEQLFTKL